MTTLSTNTSTLRDSTRQSVGLDLNIGRALRAMTTSIESRIIMAVVVVLALWAIAIATFGYPALIIPMLCMVPTMFAFLMLITVGK
jgi:hypothetical protein